MDIRGQLAESDRVIASLRAEVASLRAAAAHREDEMDVERSALLLKLREADDDHKLALQMRSDEFRSDRAAIEDRARADVAETKRECAAQIEALLEQHHMHMEAQSKHEAELRSDLILIALKWSKFLTFSIHFLKQDIAHFRDRETGE